MEPGFYFLKGMLIVAVRAVTAGDGGSCISN